jgi:hypothetical protein
MTGINRWADLDMRGTSSALAVAVSEATFMETVERMIDFEGLERGRRESRQIPVPPFRSLKEWRYAERGRLARVRVDCRNDLEVVTPDNL